MIQQSGGNFIMKEQGVSKQQHEEVNSEEKKEVIDIAKKIIIKYKEAFNKLAK
jgi:hypothetical protein